MFRKCVALLVVLCPLVLRAQWESTLGPEGGAGYMIIKHGNQLFASTLNGVYRSSDLGDSWTRSGLNGKSIYRMVSSGSALYASVDNVLYRSTDNGDSWTQVFVTEGTRIQSLLLHKNELFLSVYQQDGGAEFGGVYKSTDGSNCTKVTSGTNASYVRALISADFFLIAVTYQDGIFRSNNSGASWTQATILSSTTPTIWTARSDNGKLYAAGENAAFLYSTNYGSTWQIVTAQGIQSWDTFYDVQRAGSTLYGITLYSDTLYLSTDNGTSWHPDLSSSLPHHAYGVGSKYGLSLIDNKLFCQMEIGPFYTSTSSLNWKYGTGIQNANTRSLASYNGTLYAASLAGPFRTTNNGATWITPEDSNHLRWRSTDLCKAASALYAYGEEGIWRHNGNGWAQVDTHFTYDLEAQGDTIFWAAGYDGVFYSSDQGATKSSGNGTGANKLPVDTTVVDRIFPTGTAHIAQVGFFVDGPQPGSQVLDYRLYRSGDGMQSWHQVDSGNVNFVSHFMRYANTLYAATYGYGLFSSTDDGFSWKRMESISPVAVIDAIYASGNMIFISVYGDDVLADGIHMSRDGGGQTWKYISDNAVSTANGFTEHNGFLYASIAESGVWKRSLAELDVKEEKRATITSTIFPNPSTGYVAISGDAKKIILRSLTGVVLWQSNVSKEKRMELPQLPAGMYIAEIIGQGSRFEKLVIQ